MLRIFASLRFRLLLLALVAVLPAMGVILYSGLEQYRLAEAKAREEAMHIAEHICEHFEHTILTTRQLLQTLSHIPAVRRTNGGAGTALVKELIKTHPYYTNIVAADKAGYLFAGVLPWDSQVNFADRAWFQLAVKDRDFAISPFQVGRISGKATVQFSYPLLTQAGEVEGVVMAALDLDWLGKEMAKLHLPREAVSTIIDPQGTVLARYPDPQGLIGKSAPEAELVRIILAQGQGTTAARGLDGINRLYAFQPLPTTPVSGYVVVGIPQSTVFAPVRQVLQRNLLVLGVVLVLTMAAAYLFGHLFVTRRTQVLRDTARQLAGGDLAARTGFPGGRGELDELGRTFDHLAATLQHREAERDAAEQGLIDSEAKYRSVVDNVGIGIALISPGMEILALNNRMHTWFPDIDEAGKPICHRAFNNPPRDEICSYCPTYKTLADGEVHEAVTETPAGDEIINFRIVASPVKDAAGKTIAAIEMVEDITRKLRLEAELENHRTHLEELVQERTGALDASNEQLRQEVGVRRRAEGDLKKTITELERSNMELQQFAYVASHDLQEPLRMVSSFTQLLAQRYQGRLDPEADEFIAFAVDGATRMQRLINDLLAYSRIGSRGEPFAPTDCGAVLDQALTSLEKAVQESGAVITRDPLPTVMGDQSHLALLFQHLLDNALKFRGPEAPRIQVTAAPQGSEWVLAVKDNGIGFDPMFQERVFVIFQRLHPRDEYPGTGIGLALCKRIVERHRGRIWVESEPGQGSSFFFTLPIIDRDMGESYE